MIALRRLLKYVFIYALFASGMSWLAKRRALRNRSIAVLTLHRVLPDAEFPRTHSLPGMVLRESTFDALTRYISEFCSPTDALDPTRSTSKPAVALTFDDGWKDNELAAVPSAERHGIPLLIFLCAGLMGKPFPFWPERAVASYDLSGRERERFVERMKQMSPAERDSVLASAPPATDEELQAREPLNATLAWQNLPSLLLRGVSFGSHTCSHPILTQIPLPRAEAELALSKTMIESHLLSADAARPCAALAYPNGNWSPEVRNAAERSGYRFAFTTEHGLWKEGCDPLAIPRINISEDRVRGLRGGFSQAAFEYWVFWRSSLR